MGIASDCPLNSVIKIKQYSHILKSLVRADLYCNHHASFDIVVELKSVPRNERLRLMGNHEIKIAGIAGHFGL
ncbi:hypothetical protein KAM644c_57250 (plasmid) [Klebsiella quasipneumoniae subsp. quasipneumoniae]|jgi:hypothetical protein|uniref:Uncharacterized protein n=1 Tax=Klebsiella quasipneumoniae subsp. quasipneumoniae TaxID=1667327 RepID=A0AAN1YAZ9_9ENTR|nr:hypothetical protein KAM622c_58540 [Klebsiella quasipneumoniae subsp. quasipneumoniae]GHS69146.1 hypothetical protein KPTHUN262_56890 [Klebsiella pneumoniae]GJK94315.1 hypothetical protein TUM17568_55210 [Klebsiella oxytoca]BDO16659.1 hypothetical protein KAM644c_57250 [Klebsiella quasipneumoniae subsp. quasipneumoniae]BDO22597.1 hypothetical protein KAM645c_56870 [Klebsiella quasipneumoniae subsp. quasipneumoniae]